jgi:branched-chain amino acid transport system permease protein
VARREGILGRTWLIPPLIALLVAIIPLAAMGEYDQRQIILIAVYTLIVAGLNLSFGFAGELAFGQVAMFAAGAYITGVLTKHGHHDILLALVVSIAIAGLVGLISGIPGVRLGHWSLAITSFFLVLLVPRVVEIFESQTGGALGLPGIEAPSFLGLKLSWDAFYLIAVGVAFGWLVIMRNLVMSRQGNALKVLRESPLLASSLGLPVTRLRMQAYLLGSLPAGAAGCIYGFLTGYISPETFSLTLAITVIAASVVGGFDSIYGAPIGAAILVLGPLQTASFQRYSLFAYGVFLLVVGVLFTGGIAGIARVLTARGLTFSSGRWSWPPPARPPHRDKPATDAIEIPGEALTVRGVAKRFGGLQALDSVDLEAKPGQITAIMGPNGAGKTTLLNAISGFARIDDGEISIPGEALSALSAHRIAARGIGRTFQTPAIPRGMTVLEVVESGRLGAGRTGLAATVLRLPSFRRRRKEDRDISMAALAFAGLDGVAAEDARTLPLGTRRLLEVVRAVAGEPHVMLLDEPAAGLDDESLQELGELLRRARTAGATVIIVEHNVPFVLGIADAVHVLHLGRVLASGTSKEIRNHPEVVATYLGRSVGDVPSGQAP